MIWDVLGALLYAYVVFNVVYFVVAYITRYKLLRKRTLLITLAGALMVTGILTEFIYTWNTIIIYHIPMLFLVFLYDYIKVVRKEKTAEKIEAPLN